MIVKNKSKTKQRLEPIQTFIGGKMYNKLCQQNQIPYSCENELTLLFAMRINLRNVKFSKKKKHQRYVIAPFS